MKNPPITTRLVMSQRLAIWCLFGIAAFLTGCATPPAPVDYSEFKASRPRSIVVLPPTSSSTDVQASNSVLAQATRPLAEAGYYVFPVALVAETFKENGITQANDARDVPIEKLRQIFGADAAMYITISKYGSSYTVINSVTEVAAEAKLVDLKTGAQLWTGTAYASDSEGQNQNQGGLLGAVILAVIKQVSAAVTDQSHTVAGVATERLLSVGPKGMLAGPRSPNYGKD